MSGQLYASAALHLKKETQYPMDRRAGGQSWSGHFGEKKNFLPLPAIASQLFMVHTCHSVCGRGGGLFRGTSALTAIQGVTGGTDQTSGECSLSQTIPI